MRMRPHEKGMTIIEVIVALVILTLALSIAYPFFGLLDKSSKTQLDEHSQRNDVLLASRLLSQDVHYSKSITCPDDATVVITCSDNTVIRYMLSNEGGKTFLTRESGDQTQSFGRIKGARFIKENDDLLAVTFITDLAENNFKAARWNNTLALSPEEDFFADNRVYIYANELLVSGNMNVYGNDKTIIIKNGFTSSGNVKIKSNIYIDSGATLSGNSELGFEGSTIVINGDLVLSGNTDLYGDIYISGNLTMSGNPSIYGNVYVQGNVTKSGSGDIHGRLEYEGYSIPYYIRNCYKVSETKTEDFPEYSMPSLREPATWYLEHGYRPVSTLKSNSKIYENNAIDYRLAKDIDNAVIVSKKNITISGNENLSGVICTPNGNVTLDVRNFAGFVMAQKVTFSSNCDYTAKSIDEFFSDPSDYPFGGME